MWQEYIAAVAGVHRSMSDVSLTVVCTRIHGAGTTNDGED